MTQIEFSFSNKLFLIHLQIYVNEILNFNKLSAQYRCVLDNVVNRIVDANSSFVGDSFLPFSCVERRAVPGKRHPNPNLTSLFIHVNKTID